MAATKPLTPAQERVVRRDHADRLADALEAMLRPYPKDTGNPDAREADRALRAYRALPRELTEARRHV